MAITTEMRAEVLELYTAYFNRAADKAGVDYWTNEMDTNGWTIDQVAQSFAEQTEFTTAYAGLTNEEIVDAVYTNVLNRAADADGKTYWVDELTAGTMKVQNLIQAVVAAAKEDKDGLGDADVLANKVAVSEYAYAQNLSETIAKDISLDSITADASTVTSIKGTVDTAVTAAVATSTEAIALTTSSDVITGTSADDTINAYVGTNTVNGNNQDTISSIDIIDGGAGNDTLNIQQSSTTNINGATVANVENIVFTQFGNQSFNMSNVTGLESFTNKGSINTTTLTAVDSIIDLTVQNVNSNNTILTYNDTAVAGTTDVMNVTLSNASNSSDITIDSATAGAIETLNITSTGSANKVTLANNTAANDTLAATKTLNISGDQDLNLTATTMAGLTTVTSTSTGNVTIDLSRSAAKDATVTLGAGDDKITTSDITKDDVIDMGAGSDTLVLTAATDTTTAATLTGVETLAVAVSANASLNLDKATELTTLAVGTGTGNATGVGAEIITVSKVAASATTISYDTQVGTVGGMVYDEVVFKLKSATGTSDALTINVQNTDTNGNHIASRKDTQKVISEVTANGIETISIKAADMGVDDSAVLNDSGLVITALTDDKLQTLNIESDTQVTITGGLDNDINDINAENAAGGVRLNLTNGADNSETTHASTTLNIDTGAGADTLSNIKADVATTVINTGAGKDSITLKAGDFGDGATNLTLDTITIDAGAGNDTVDVSASTTLVAEGTISVTLGDGVDTVKIDGAAANQTGITITDFTVGSGGDKIDLVTAAVDTDAVGELTVTKYLELDGTVDAQISAGMNIITKVTSASLSTADVAARLADTDGNGTADTVKDADAETGIWDFDDGENAYIVISDGTDSGLYRFDEGSNGDTAGGTAIAAGELTLIATLTGVSDTSELTVDNFTDFLA